MSYLLDTNVLSELRKGKDCDPGVRRWWSGVEEIDLHLSVMVLGEIRRGIAMIQVRNPGKARELENWLQSVVQGFGPRLLIIERKVAEAWGAMTVKRTLPLVDGLLAATAVAHNLTLVTRNTRDIEDSGALFLNPWET